MAEKDVPAKEPVSIRESLEQEYSRQENPEPVEAAPEETPEKETKPERARAPDGKFAKQEKEEKKDEPKAEEVKAILDEINPEEHWSAEDKSAFKLIPNEHRKWVFDRYKRLEADNTRKSQESAQLRSYKQQLDAVLEPYRQEFALSGMDEIGAIRYLMGIRDYLKNKPAEAFQWLAQQYGVDLANLNTQVDPAQQAVSSQMGQIGNELNTLRQQLYNEKVGQLTKQIEGFSKETDATGNLKHPHFEAVSETMTQLFKSGMVQPGDLETAYQKAVAFQGLTHPVPAQVQTVKEEPKETQKNDELEKAAAAAKAKKAAAGIDGGSTSKKERPMTMREELEARYDGRL